MTNITLQYVQDSNGKVQAVQMPLGDWEKIVASIRKYEQILQVKSDLLSAFADIRSMQSGKVKKQQLSDFLDEL
jgi:hypothetical protein